MAADRSGRPNILLIMVDQLADQWLDLADTPSIDRLATDGVRFRSTYSNSPLCAPARFALMSGRRNSTIGAYDNASEFTSSTPTFVHHLRAGGYHTSLIGKMHFVGADQLHGFEERLTTDIYPADFGWTPNWADPEGRFDWWFHNMDSVTSAGVAEASNQLDYDDEVGFRAVRKLRDLARSGDDRPWLVTVSFTHPHDPYVARQDFWDLYANGVPAPAVPAVADPDPHSARLAHVISADVTTVDDRQVANARRAYLANTSYVDRFVGQLLDTLERHDMADNTHVVFTADHGDMLGERGLWYKMNFFEPAARIPLIIKGAGDDPRGCTARDAGPVGCPTSLLDIGPTLLDLAGLDPGALHDGGPDPTSEPPGSSVLPLIESPQPDRTVLGEYLGEGAVAPIFMIRRGRYKYIWSRPDPPQLYDLEADPLELDNLAATGRDGEDGGSFEAATAATEFAAEVQHRWDVEAVERDVLASQRARSLIDGALRQGRHRSWDFQPFTDAGDQYMRNHLDLNEVESSRRLL